MKVTGTSTVNVLLLAVVAVAAGAGCVWLILSAQVPTEPTIVAGQFKQYQAATDVFRSRYTNYEGMCQDLGLPPAVACQSDQSRYRIHLQLEDGTYYCIDSAAAAGVVPRQPQGLSCL